MLSTHRGAAFPSRTSRVLASVALGAAVVLGATGCNMVAPQATTIQYSPAEGTNIADFGPVTVRNALLVANDDGSAANLLAALVNDTDQDETIKIGVGGTTQSVDVPARSAVSLGFEGVDPLLFEGVDHLPGTYATATFQVGADGAEQSIPVLDGTLSYLADFVPDES
ncbi:hypothetical protein [Microbacterium sp. No. 7]|uniref:hypothetical protein n=1 Tax=Microbacterium sp. No. 7 TaxID=1714373 RepID=UPI0006D0A8CB|nr:hypothetical protein [Microbacterium sp. No. 7]ALJ19635.1 DNA modification methylase [Microbacterium sp. No. 7]